MCPRCSFLGVCRGFSLYLVRRFGFVAGVCGFWSSVGGGCSGGFPVVLVGCSCCCGSVVVLPAPVWVGSAFVGWGVVGSVGSAASAWGSGLVVAVGGFPPNIWLTKSPRWRSPKRKNVNNVCTGTTVNRGVVTPHEIILRGHGQRLSAIAKVNCSLQSRRSFGLA